MNNVTQEETSTNVSLSNFTTIVRENLCLKSIEILVN